jgi:hypothetical protein
VRLVDLVEAAKLHPWVQRSRLVQGLGLIAMRGLQQMGVQTWGTKSFEFWTLLAATLWMVRPRSIVELGSGRSTQYLADYAMKEGIPFVSVEQARGWARRVKRGLAAGLVTGDFVHHVPITPDGWYDIQRLDALVRFPCEGLYVDGPVGAQERLGKATRDGGAARTWLARTARPARLLVVDDVHREENLELLRVLIAEAGDLVPFFLPYRPGRGGENIVAVAIETAVSARLSAACSALGIAATREAKTSAPEAAR